VRFVVVVMLPFGNTPEMFWIVLFAPWVVDSNAGGELVMVVHGCVGPGSAAPYGVVQSMAGGGTVGGVVAKVVA
jgi:hypothetical protein